ncbi:hypothetical protein [Dactylosporangium sp. CS-033363]|uniref:hypothetical protein n=1 Tax=Dactylosporangium sp. CS-033363 TaxID=3239935 RepID=UPI003D8E9597
MQTRELTWDEAVQLFERRGLPESSYENLYDEEYLLVSGDTHLAGDLRLNGDPFGAGAGAVTGYIVDGSLTVDGNLYDEDDGAAALVVLGTLRARDVFLWCDPKLIVQGNVEVGLFAGEMTDKLVMIHGDLRAGAIAYDAEFEPDLVEGETISGGAELLVGFAALRERVHAGRPVLRPA